MRCKNSGSDYDDDSIQWTCTASLPDEFKLGSTDVICEGYDYPEDPYILKGSCGVEYRLVLTEKGEAKYGKKKHWSGDDDGDSGYEQTTGDKVVASVFWMIFICVAGWIIYNAVRNWYTGQGGAVGGGGNRPGWGGGGGWGGGYGGNDDDPPPPYDWRPGSGAHNKQSYGSTNNQSWRPGFFSGAAGGAAAGYAAGRFMGGGRNNNQTTGSGWGSSRWNNGEGSSRSSSGSSGSGNYSSTRHESTGFGSTSRR